jgi:hypothetical protein
MGTTLYGKMKWGLLKLDMNFYSGELLTWLCWGIKKKFGVYAPMTADECKMVARILRNKAGIFEIWASEPKKISQRAHYQYYHVNNHPDYLDDPWRIQWMRDVADFFDKIHGLVDVDGYNEE